MSKLFVSLSAKVKELRHIALTNQIVQASPAKKYISNYFTYVAEKLHAIEYAELKSNSKCLDISTGSGLLPFILKELGHTCDATDIINNEHDLDFDVQNNDKTQKSAFDIMREVHGVNISELNIERLKPITISKKYDCIFSTRIVWDSGWGDSNNEAYSFIVNNLLEYSNKVVLSWNKDDDNDVADCIKPYLVEQQFEYGRLSIHTEKI